jgi:hypothetical protein
VSVLHSLGTVTHYAVSKKGFTPLLDVTHFERLFSAAGKGGATIDYMKITIILCTAVIWTVGCVSGEKRSRDNEMGALFTVTSINTVQKMYFSQYGKFAETLTALGSPANGSKVGPTAANLLDPELASSGMKHGYKFTLRPTADGYAINANPITPGPGKWSLFSDQTMTIHEHKGPEPASETDPVISYGR